MKQYSVQLHSMAVMALTVSVEAESAEEALNLVLSREGLEFENWDAQYIDPETFEGNAFPYFSDDDEDDYAEFESVKTLTERKR